jgi:hypothetical protein
MSRAVIDVLGQALTDVNHELEEYLIKPHVIQAFRLLADALDIESAQKKIRRFDETEPDEIVEIKALDMLGNRLRDRYARFEKGKR